MIETVGSEWFEWPAGDALEGCDCQSKPWALS